jgi:hypothetical protein
VAVLSAALRAALVHLRARIDPCRLVRQVKQFES